MIGYSLGRFIRKRDMIFQVLFVIGAMPLIFLGGMHLYFTVKDNRHPTFIVPRSIKLIRDMQAEPLRVTSETDMWRAWIGFNISHSIAVLLVGIGTLYLVWVYPQWVVSDILMLWASPVLAWVFVILSRCFWFSKPFQGTLVSAVLLTAAAIAATLPI